MQIFTITIESSIYERDQSLNIYEKLIAIDGTKGNWKLGSSTATTRLTAITKK